MKRALAIFALVLALVAWWATSRQPSVTEGQLVMEHSPAPYPTDFEQRLSRVAGLRLELNAPLPDALP